MQGLRGELVDLGDVGAQAARASADLERGLHADGSCLANVVELTIFLTVMRTFPKVVEFSYQ